MKNAKYKNKAYLLAALKQQPLLQGLTEDEFSIVVSLLKLRSYSSNDDLLQEHEKSNELYFILEGEVEILKWDADKEKLFGIGKLGQHMAFGEMSFIDNLPRSSTVRATQEVIICFFSKKKLLKNSAGKNIYHTILANIAKLDVDRLRLTTQRYVASLQQEIKAVKQSNDFGKFFIMVIIMFGIGNAVNQFLKIDPINTTTWIFNWSYLILLIIPIGFLVAIYKYPLQTFGVTFINWKKSLIEGVLISMMLLPLLIGVYWLLVYSFHYSLPKYALLGGFTTFFGPWIIFYYLNCYVQEFIARGVTQTCLERFLDHQSSNTKNLSTNGLSKNLNTTSRKAIFLTSLVFAMFHAHINMSISILTFFASLLFGFIYARQKNLLGVTVVHGTLGLAAIYFGLM